MSVEERVIHSDKELAKIRQYVNANKDQANSELSMRAAIVLLDHIDRLTLALAVERARNERVEKQLRMLV